MLRDGEIATTSSLRGRTLPKETAPQLSGPRIGFVPRPACTVSSGDHASEVPSLSVPLSRAGTWTVSLWRRDAAGNESETMASVPVALNYDPEPPQLAFESPSTSDPTLVAARFRIPVSGVAEGAIEISAAGVGSLASRFRCNASADRLLARIDDVALPPGPYQLRARAVDQARNEASTELRTDGQPMLLNLPLRVVSGLQTAFERQRVVRERRRTRRTIVLTQTARVLFGAVGPVAGRLVNPDGAGFPGAEVQVHATTPLGAEQLSASFRPTPRVVTATRLQALRIRRCASCTPVRR